MKMSYPPSPLEVRMKRRRTFTLVEILVMLAIIGLIAGLLLPNLHKKHQRALRNSAST
jgi:type II secretory pathway pseudopilin PulG